MTGKGLCLLVLLALIIGGISLDPAGATRSDVYGCDTKDCHISDTKITGYVDKQCYDCHVRVTESKHQKTKPAFKDYCSGCHLYHNLGGPK